MKVVSYTSIMNAQKNKTDIIFRSPMHRVMWKKTQKLTKQGGRDNQSIRQLLVTE